MEDYTSVPLYKKDLPRFQKLAVEHSANEGKKKNHAEFLSFLLDLFEKEDHGGR